MFGMLAVFGDMGASLGPWIAGIVSDTAESMPQAFPAFPSGGSAMKYGILAAVIFPMLMIVGALFFRSFRKGSPSENLNT